MSAQHWFAAAVLLGALTETEPAAAQKQLVPATLTTGFTFTGGSAAPLVFAEKRGYFADNGIKINIVPGAGSADAVSKIGAGAYQAGTGYLPALLRAKSENPDLDAVAVTIAYDAAPDGLVGPRGAGLAGPKDLVGKRISAQPNNTSMITFPIFATAVGIDPGSVHWVSVGAPLLAITVQQGNADLAAGFVTTAVANFEKIGYSPDKLISFTYSDYVPNFYGNALILQKSWAEKNPDAAKGLVRAYIRGLIETRQHEAEAMDDLMEREPLLKKDIEAADLQASFAKYYFTSRVLKNGIGYQSSADVDAFIKELVNPMNLKRTPSASEIYTTEYLPPVAERQVPQ